MNNYSAELFSNLTGKKIIITGYKGYIGNELTNQLDIKNIDYIGIDKTTISKINCLQFNLSDRKKLTEVIIAEKPDYIFHTATHSALAYKNDFLHVFQEDYSVLYNIISNFFYDTTLSEEFHENLYHVEGEEIKEFIYE